VLIYPILLLYQPLLVQHRVSKTITPGSQRPDVASTNAHQPPVINIQNTVVTQPLTVVIPIETDAQNAQICVTILSSGSQSCQQVALDPEQGSYTPVNVDLSQHVRYHSLRTNNFSLSIRREFPLLISHIVLESSTFLMR
jgi:hypothetical protein